MNYHILKEYNFTEPEIDLFQILIDHGESTVSQILEHTPLSRTSVHDALNSLLARDFLEYRKDGRNAYYKAVHPNKLYAVLEEKKQATARLNAEMEEVIRTMTGSYNLTESKPGVRFFEGAEGFKTALDDTLRATDTIYTYLDYASLTLEKELLDINTAYVVKRREKQIQKHILVPNSPENIAAAAIGNGPYTEIRILPKGIVSFPTSMQIYDNTISYFTLRAESVTSIIIDDAAISAMHKALFIYHWGVSMPLEAHAQKQNTDLKNPSDQ